MVFRLLPNKKYLISRFLSFHSFHFCGFWVFLLSYGFLLHIFWFFENVFIGYVDTFNGTNIVFDSLVKLKWRVYCQKSRLYFPEDKILHGSTNTIHWTFPVAFLIVKPTQLDPFQKTVCQKTEDKTGSELGSAAITPNYNFGVFYCIDRLALLDYFFQTCQGCIQLWSLLSLITATESFFKWSPLSISDLV